MEHFGIRLVQRKYSLRLNRDEFAPINTKPSFLATDLVTEFLMKKGAYTDSSCTKYTLQWCNEYRNLCLQNYDLSIKYFNSLNYEDFNYAISAFLKKHHGFKEISTLTDCNHMEGYYLMVLDEYKQAYIGKSEDIKKRIQSHWHNTVKLDRTLFPLYAVTTSCFQVDFFRALDTTRIFVWPRPLSDGLEKKLVDAFPKAYCLNRIGGDVSTGLEALATINKRSL